MTNKNKRNITKAKKPFKLTPTIKKLRQEIDELYRFILSHIATGKFEKDALQKEKGKLIEIRTENRVSNYLKMDLPATSDNNCFRLTTLYFQ